MKHDIFPCLWFDGNAETAAKFYCSVFPDSEISSVNPMVVIFRINGKKYMGLNGGPMFKFTEAVSLVVTCDTQEEIDYYWSKLGDGGTEQQCGWLKDQFGLSWQIVPSILGELMNDPERAGAVTQAFMKMKKFDIEALKNAR